MNAPPNSTWIIALVDGNKKLMRWCSGMPVPVSWRLWPDSKEARMRLIS